MKLDLVAKHVESKLPLLVFLDRNGEVDSATLNQDELDFDTDNISWRLHKEAGCLSYPYFEICSVLDGVIWSGGDEITIDELPLAVKEAEAERERFYVEREQEYGASVWPMQVSTQSAHD